MRGHGKSNQASWLNEIAYQGTDSIIFRDEIVVGRRAESTV